MMSKEDNINALLDKVKTGQLSNDDFAILMRELLISEGGYILPWGQDIHVNAEIARILLLKIKKHPFIWKLFFMVG